MLQRDAMNGHGTPSLLIPSRMEGSIFSVFPYMLAQTRVISSPPGH
jgi:hypothetical protein